MIGALVRRQSGNTAMIAVGWLLLFGVIFWLVNDWMERDSRPNRNLSATATGEIVLQRSRDGHYYADGEINGRRVVFLLDTGATQIALPMSLARDLGLKLGPTIDIQTAAGRAKGYPARLASVRLATVEMRDLGAVVSEGMNGDTVLLGMNFLKRLEITQRGDQLILKPMVAGNGPD